MSPRHVVVSQTQFARIPPALTLDHGPDRRSGSRGSLWIGRDRDAALPLDDDEASRRHAELVHDAAADRWIVRDAGSRNGLWVDGARVERASLGHGTVVRIGRTLLIAVDVVVAAGQRWRRETRALRGNSVAMQRVRGEIATLAIPRHLRPQRAAPLITRSRAAHCGIRFSARIRGRDLLSWNRALVSAHAEDRRNPATPGRSHDGRVCSDSRR
jgi:hypothetical protein